MDTIDFKRGDTFSYASMLTLPAGTWSAACQIRDLRGSLVQDMTVSLVPPVAPATQHSILIEAPATATALWPLETLQGDVKFSDASAPSVVMHTGSFELNVLKKVTE